MTANGPTSGIPVINMAVYRTQVWRHTRHVADAVAKACEEIGFFSLIGYGVPPPIIARLETLCRAFFDEPESAKCKIASSGAEPGGLSYFGLKAERLAATLGDTTPADYKESLDYGPGFRGDSWPDEPAGFRDAWLDYYAALSALAADLRSIFAVALGLSETYFDDAFDRHLSSLRVLNYPEQTSPPKAGQIRAGTHTDYGALTILRANDAPGGLQVRNRAGAWVDVPGAENAFIVNIGDAFMRWTNDHWISTPHRVVNPPPSAATATRRQSIAFFHNPNGDAVISCLPGLATDDDTTKYPPIMYRDYAELRYRQAHGSDKSLGLSD